MQSRKLRHIQATRTSYRAWKKGKNWLYATTAAVVMVGAGAVNGFVHADTTSDGDTTTTATTTTTTAATDDVTASATSDAATSSSGSSATSSSSEASSVASTSSVTKSSTSSSTTSVSGGTMLPINTPTASNPYSGENPVYITTPGGLYSYPAYNYAEDSFGNAGYLDTTTGEVVDSQVAILAQSSSATVGQALQNPASYFSAQTPGESSVAANVVAGEFTPAGTTSGQAISTTTAVTSAQAGTYTYIAATTTSAGQIIYATYTITVAAQTVTGTIGGHDSTLTVGSTWSNTSNLDSVTIDGNTYTTTTGDWSQAGIPSGYSLEETDNVDTSQAGVYQVTYTLTDANGNTIATTTQTVTVTGAGTSETPSSAAPDTSVASDVVSSAAQSATTPSKVLPSTGDAASSEILMAAGAALLAGAATLEMVRRRKRKESQTEN
jgi:LPXTG-motif cell wall-anchored protein